MGLRCQLHEQDSGKSTPVSTAPSRRCIYRAGSFLIASYRDRASRVRESLPSTSTGAGYDAVLSAIFVLELGSIHIQYYLQFLHRKCSLLCAFQSLSPETNLHGRYTCNPNLMRSSVDRKGLSTSRGYLFGTDMQGSAHHTFNHA